MKRKISLNDRRLNPSPFSGFRREPSRLDEWVQENFQPWEGSDDQTEQLRAGKDGKTLLVRYPDAEGETESDECVAVYQMQKDDTVTATLFTLRAFSPINVERQYISKRSDEIILSSEQAQFPLRQLRVIAMQSTAKEISKISANDPNDKRLESLQTFFQNMALAAQAAQELREANVQKPLSFKMHEVLGRQPK